MLVKHCKQTAENENKFSKIAKNKASHTHLGFTNIGSEMHSFNVIGHKKGNIDLDHSAN